MIRLGIIGTGGMAHHHAESFQQIRGVKVVACCDIDAERVQAFAAKHAIPRAYIDYRQMLAQEKLDAITNVTPDAQHAEVSLAVIASGRHILCEKPLATSLADAREMARAAAAAGVINMVNFSYRNSCGLQKAADVVRSGKLGRILHVESSYLQSWLVNASWGDWRSSPGLTWRLSTHHGSAGVLGDLGCHIFDLTTLLCGLDIADITCTLKTFDKGVPDNTLGEYVLDANDSFIATTTFTNGAIGTIHSSRWATGHGNSLRCRVYGDRGAIEIDLDRAYDEYRICTGADTKTFTWKTVKAKPTPTNFQRFINAIKTGIPDPCDFANGVKIQAYLHYCFASAEQHGPVAVE
ncbi:MAG: Gfo/Idh/MocA family protein [Armatimonadota bacterium]